MFSEVEMTDLLIHSINRQRTRKDELEDAAREFNLHNPQVWRLFVKSTNEMISRGFTHYSVNGVFERIRWETDQADDSGGSTFRLNNNHRSFYARWYADAYPQHRNFFRFRNMSSEFDDAKNLSELGPESFPYVDH
jgi:hypothetical protein